MDLSKLGRNIDRGKGNFVILILTEKKEIL